MSTIINIVLSFCEKNNLGLDPSPETSSTNISVKITKKIEKHNSMGKNIKSFHKSRDIDKDNIKNSYYNKYLYFEECNRSKLNNKVSNPLRQSKAKEMKKRKNNSMEKMEKSLHYSNKNLNNYINNRKKTEANLSKDKDKNESKTTTKKYSGSNTSLSKSANSDINVNLKSKLTKDYDTLNYNKIPKIKNLSSKENAFLILSYSDVLRLCERFTFSRSTSKLRESVSKKQILEYNIYLLKKKITECEKKISICNEKLAKKFSATKIAEFTLNFITNNIENEFRYDLFSSLEDNEKKQFFSYIKYLYIFLNENYEQIPDHDLIDDLYKKINSKGYSNIKDYLYSLYIKNSKENIVVENIDKINALLKEIPDFSNYQNSLKYSKFISYNSYLIMELSNYANDKVDTLKLKQDCENFIKVIYNKINIYNEKNE